MVSKRIPIFADGNILTKEMLCACSDFLFSVPDLFLEGYSDGIVSGCELSADSRDLILGKGLIRFGGKLFRIGNEYRFAYAPTNQNYYLKAVGYGEKHSRSFEEYCLELVLTDLQTQEGEIEFCRFKLQEGARLRFLYDDFEDLCTEYGTINLLYAPFCGQGESTLHPKVLKRFAKELLSLQPENPIDTAFCLQALGTERGISLDAAAAYLSVKGESLSDLSNRSVYDGLLRVFQEERQKSNDKPTKKTERKPFILVD